MYIFVSHNYMHLYNYQLNYLYISTLYINNIPMLYKSHIYNIIVNIIATI